MAVKNNRRTRKKYPAVDPRMNLKTRYEEIVDIASYFDTLPESAKEWMNSFVEESVNANFNHKGPKIYTKVEDKRAIYGRNNARNRDILTKVKACGKYIELDDPLQLKQPATVHDEDAINAKIDHDVQQKRYDDFAKERRKAKRLKK